MTIGDEINKTIIAATPAGPVIAILKIVALVIAALFATWVIWKLFFADRQAAKKTEALTSELATRRETGANQSGQDTVRIVVDNNSRAAGVARQTQEVLNALLRAKGADQVVDPDLAGIARSAICVRASAAGLSSCRKLLEASP